MADTLHVYDSPPPGANADWTIPQNWGAFNADDHAMWDQLFARQSAMLPGRAADAFLRGMDVLKLSKPGIPDYRELNARLRAATGRIRLTWTPLVSTNRATPWLGCFQSPFAGM